MHVLVTRPYEQALETRRKLLDIDCRVSIESVLEIEKIQYSSGIYKNSNGFIVTSVHAAKEIAKQTYLDRNISVFAVGYATAKPLKDAGFTNIYEAYGDAKNLLQLIKNKRGTDEGLLTYLSGWHITQDIARVLAMDGYDAQRVVCYKATPKKKLNNEIVQLIKKGKIHVVMFYSYRTAYFFSQLIENEKINSSLKNMVALTMSEYVASALNSSDWKGVMFTKQPSQDSLISEIVALKTNNGPCCRNLRL